MEIPRPPLVGMKEVICLTFLMSESAACSLDQQLNAEPPIHCPYAVSLNSNNNTYTFITRTHLPKDTRGVFSRHANMALGTDSARFVCWPVDTALDLRDQS